MSYNASYTSLSKDSNHKSDRNRASVGATIFLVLLMLLIFWRFFSKLDPKPEPGGLEASFGNVMIASGGGSESPTEELQKDPQPKTTPNTKNIPETKTTDKVKSEVVNTDKTKKTSKSTTESKNSSKSSSSNTEKKAFVPGFGNFADGDPGKQGTENGKKDNLGKVGPGGNGTDGPGGNGTGLLGTRRTCVGQCECDLSPSDLAKITHIRTKVYVQVTIDASGKVIDAKIPSKEFLVENSNPTDAEKRIALKCAKQYSFKAADETTKGVVVIPLRQQ